MRNSPCRRTVLVIHGLCWAVSIAVCVEAYGACGGDCLTRGNCVTGELRCDCPVGYGGKVCSELLLPACRLASNASYITCDLHHQRPMNCECLQQCKEYYCQGGLCTYPFDQPPSHKCFERLNTPKEHQLSALPASDDSAYSWHDRPDGPQISAEEGATRGGREQAVPLEACPGSCSLHGWCMKPKGSSAKPYCSCIVGFRGPTCSQVDSSLCLNNCSGHGTCQGGGFCHCRAGYWGRDCSLSDGPSERPSTWPMLRGGPAGNALRVYIYELPPHIAHLHVDATDPNYAAPDRFSELLYQDWQVRTQNPWEASLFFLPALNLQYTSNMMDANSHMRAVIHWAKTTYPFWNASLGKDHFFWITGDRNNCYFDLRFNPDILNPIRLTHFGYHARNSTLLPWLPDKAVGCFDFLRDIAAAPHSVDEGVVTEDPRYRIWAKEYRNVSRVYSAHASVALHNEQGGAQGVKAARQLQVELERFVSQVDGKRDILLLWAGSTRRDDPEYSGGARAALIEAVKDVKGSDVKVFDGAADGDYFDMMWRARYCFVPYGHGWGIRLTQVVARGCVPVIVQDSVVQYFEDLLPYPHFSLRFRQADMPVLVQRLRALPPAHLKLLQVGLRRYHRVFFWNPRAPVHGLAYNYTILSLRHRLRNHLAGYF